VIAIHPDNGEEVIASGLSIGDAEDLCVRKIEVLRSVAPAPALADARPAPTMPPRKKHGARQLAFRFE
jgi:hypothetical protein